MPLSVASDNAKLSELNRGGVKECSTAADFYKINIIYFKRLYESFVTPMISSIPTFNTQKTRIITSTEHTRLLRVL